MTFQRSEEKIPVSVLIPAKNEEKNLPECLKSLARADEIFVVVSDWEDKTVAIAQEHGAKVERFDFNGSWPKKKNWSLDNVDFTHDWVLIVDCDERITDALWDEIKKKIDPQSNPERINGYYLNRKVYFLNRWLRHGGRYPDWNMRLFNRKIWHYEKIIDDPIPNIGDNEVHEHMIPRAAYLEQRQVHLAQQVDSQESHQYPEPKAAYLNEDMDHKDERDLHAWLARHNRYSTWEAYVYRKLLTDRAKSEELQANLFGTPTERTRWFKRIWVRLPLRPVLRFILVYFAQLGFLDRFPGFVYACLLSHYEFNISIKLYELQRCDGKLNSGEKKTDAEPCSASIPASSSPVISASSADPVLASEPPIATTNESVTNQASGGNAMTFL